MLNTHKKINSRYCGKVVTQKQNFAKVVLHTNIDMLADEQGLIHGGFTFNGADYAAMVAINEPNVLLVGADTKFLAPIKVGEVITFIANVKENNFPKATVDVEAKVNNKIVFRGTFKTYVTKQHILER